MKSFDPEWRATATCRSLQRDKKNL